MKRVLITGAKGHSFIGRNLCETLPEDKYELLAPSSAELDICDLEAVRKYVQQNRVDAIIHSAVHNRERQSPERILDANLRMFYNIQTVAPMVERVLCFGSGAEFDKRRDIYFAKESEIGEHIPADPYGFAKYIINQSARESKNIYNLRLFAIFGKYERWQYTLISMLCCKAIFDSPVRLRQNCLFDYMWVNDLVPIVERCLDEKPEHHDYNVCSGKAVELLEIIKIVERVSGKKLELSVQTPGYNRAYVGDNARVKTEFAACFSELETAVSSLYEYYLEHRSIIDSAELERI